MHRTRIGRKVARAALALLLALPAMADRPEYAWGFSFDGLRLDAVEADASGNVYACFSEHIPSESTTESGYENDSHRLAHLYKFDGDGNLLWNKEIAGPRAVGAAITAGPGGAVYVFGSVQGLGTLDPGGAAVAYEALPDEYSDGMYPGEDPFILKLASDGTYIWAALLENLNTTSGPGSPVGLITAANYAWLASQTVGTSDELVIWNRFVPAIHNPASGVAILDNPGIELAIVRLTPDGELDGYFNVGQSAGQMEPSVLLSSPAGSLRIAGRYASTNNGPFDFNPGAPQELRLFNHAIGSTGETEGGVVWQLSETGGYLGAAAYAVDVGNSPRAVIFAGAVAADGTERYLAYGVDESTAVLTGNSIGTPRTISDANLADRLYGVLVFDGDGAFQYAAQLPWFYAHPSEDPNGEFPALPLLPGPGTARVNANGDVYHDYAVDVAGVQFDAHTTLPPDSVFRTVIVKLDTQLGFQWFVERTGGDLGIDAVAPAGAIYHGVTRAFEADGPIDLDPTDGTDPYTPDETGCALIKIVDILEPDATAITRLDANPTNAATVAFTVTFDEPVTGVDTSDFALTTTGAVTGAAITGVTGSDAVWTVTVNTGSGEGTIRLDLLDDDTIKSATNEPLGGPGAGNGAFTDGEAYTMDYSPPVATFALPGSELSVINSVEVLISFNEPVTGLDANDFAVTNGTITNITGDGTDFVITVLITNPGDMTLDLTGGGLTDTAGNGNGPAAGLTVTFLDINGDPSVPGTNGWFFVVLLLGMAYVTLRVTAPHRERKT